MKLGTNELHRVELLEVQNRWLKRTIGLIGVAIVLSLLLGMSEQQSRSLRAEEVVLVDAHGEPCAWLEVGAEGFPQLRLKKSGSHLTLGLQEQASFLASGTLGKGVTFFGVNESGPYLNFRGGNMKNGAWLGVEQDGSAGLHLYGESLKVGAAVRVESDGAPVIRLNDNTGSLLKQFPEE